MMKIEKKVDDIPGGAVDKDNVLDLIRKLKKIRSGQCLKDTNKCAIIISLSTK